MTLRRKRDSVDGSKGKPVREMQKIPLPHNSAFVLGLQTNREWLHGIRPDKRPLREKSSQELSFNGERISITFRSIGTYMNLQNGRIWGSGARSKMEVDANRISYDSRQAEQLVIAFGNENHSSIFDWKSGYGGGFDVVDLVFKTAKLRLCDDPIANMRVRLALSNKRVRYEIVQPTVHQDPCNPSAPRPHGLSNLESPVLTDADTGYGTPLEGDLSILIHLENRYSSAVLENIQGYSMPQFLQCAAESNDLLYLWRELMMQSHSSPTHRFRLERLQLSKVSLDNEVRQTLHSWEKYMIEEKYDFIAGGQWTILDCVFWPVCHQIMSHKQGLSPEDYPALLAYHSRGLPIAQIAKLFE